MADDANILGADGKVQPSAFATAESEAADVKVLDAGGDLVLSGSSSEAVQFALDGFIQRGSRVVSAASQVGRRWVAACTVPPNASDLDTTQTLNLADAVRSFDTNGTRMLSGTSAAAVEFALNGFVELGSKTLSPVSQVGKIWIASCTVPPNATAPDSGDTPVELDDGCSVESLGFKRIIRGPSRLIVQHRVEQMRGHGAHLIGEIELEDDEWVAVCDTAGS